MSIKYKVDNDFWDVEEEQRKLIEQVYKKMQVATKIVQNEAKILCPVQTGRLRNSITTGCEIVSPDEVVGTVSTNVEYAGFVHDGVLSRKPQPFLRNALENTEEEVIKKLQEV